MTDRGRRSVVSGPRKSGASHTRPCRHRSQWTGFRDAGDDPRWGSRKRPSRGRHLSDGTAFGLGRGLGPEPGPGIGLGLGFAIETGRSAMGSRSNAGAASCEGSGRSRRIVRVAVGSLSRAGRPRPFRSGVDIGVELHNQSLCGAHRDVETRRVAGVEPRHFRVMSMCHMRLRRTIEGDRFGIATNIPPRWSCRTNRPADLLRKVGLKFGWTVGLRRVAVRPGRFDRRLVSCPVPSLSSLPSVSPVPSVSGALR
jgi:hypothetical protein